MPGSSENPAKRTDPNGAPVFREGRPADRVAIRAILQEASLSLHAPSGSEATPRREIATQVGSTFVHLCEHRGAVVAVLQWRNLGEEAEILDVAVPAMHRRRGHARFLLEKFLNLARDRGIRDVFLEVRESNAPAIALYCKFGFSDSGRRPDYYRAPVEAALLFHLKVSG
jgi:ribosomal protein S18 acetylase RimI-like enzyme